MVRRASPCKADGGCKPPVHWRTAEALGHAYFLERGGRVLVSPYDGSTYDFVVDWKDRFVRVNVKVATPRPSGYLVSRAGRSTKTEPDLYLVWLSNEECFVELPGDFITTQTRRITKAHLAQLFEGVPLA